MLEVLTALLCVGGLDCSNLSVICSVKPLALLDGYREGKGEGGRSEFGVRS